jgi:hypothetical protein
MTLRYCHCFLVWGSERTRRVVNGEANAERAPHPVARYGVLARLCNGYNYLFLINSYVGSSAASG